MHVGCLGVIWVGWSATAVVVAVLLYILRAFALTAFYHRYFSHRAFKTSRWFQFVGGLLGTTAMQKGPLWWAAHHRLHHREADQEGDVHSPNAHSFLWSHVGWIVSKQHSDVREKLIGDWLKFPELRWLDRHSLIVGLAYAVVLYVAGELLAAYLPTLDTSGSMLVVWGFFISTVALYHATYAVNSFSHLFGTRRFETRDNSRNNLVVAILTLGEGWHNNHHRYQSSTRQGFVWWELDVTYYALLVLSKLRLVWELRPVPQHVMDTAVDRRDNLRR
jgi:stearoyl-CoA desaturase (delta-9 desaturase)